MEINIRWFDGRFPSFNVEVASKAGNEPFVTVKGCRIVTGEDGDFVSAPSTKGDNGKYWSHAYFSKDFAAVVLERAKESMPKPQQAKQPSVSSDFDSDIPF